MIMIMMPMLPPPWKEHLAKAPLALLLLAATVAVVQYEISAPLLYHAVRGTPRYHYTDEHFVSPSLDPIEERHLSLSLGGGDCKWQPPEYEVPENIDFHKTIIAGYPSGDKRMIYIQMEGLSAWPAKDEWDFEYLGITNHPFIKANYPHHEGVWGWGDVADQVVLMVRNIRRSMVEYHDILWDLGYPETYAESSLRKDDLYGERPPIEDFFAWRDKKVMDECYWYGWFIDYWMEGGLMRDMFTHKITTPEHWYMLLVPSRYSREQLEYDDIVGADTVVAPTYDPHCGGGQVTDGCAPVEVISAEKLRDYTDGPAETTKIAQVLCNDPRTCDYVIEPAAWDCIWEELIQNGRGVRTVHDRPGFVESDYNFSAEMLEQMIEEVTRLIDKYASPAWSHKDTANRIVELLVEHRALIQVELNEVNAGVRKLKENDFLGPKERARRRLQAEEKKGSSGGAAAGEGERKDYSEYFQALETRMEEEKMEKRKRRATYMKEKRMEKQRAERKATVGEESKEEKSS